MRPGTGFIGCEPFLNGVVSALGHIREDGLDNVRLYMGDALDVLNRLPDASLERVYLLHPDWARNIHSTMATPPPTVWMHPTIKACGIPLARRVRSCAEPSSTAPNWLAS